MLKKLIIVSLLIGPFFMGAAVYAGDPEGDPSGAPTGNPIYCPPAGAGINASGFNPQVTALKSQSADTPPGLVNTFAKSACDAYFVSPYGGETKIHGKLIKKRATTSRSPAKDAQCKSQNNLQKGDELDMLPKNSMGVCLHYVRNILKEMFGTTFSTYAAARDAGKDLAAGGFQPTFYRAPKDTSTNLGPAPQANRFEIRVYSGGTAMDPALCGKYPCGHIEICYMGSCLSDHHADRPLDEADADAHSPHPHILTGVYTIGPKTPPLLSLQGFIKWMVAQNE